jgi:hypothetical protein
MSGSSGKVTRLVGLIGLIGLSIPYTDLDVLKEG